MMNNQSGDPFQRTTLPPSKKRAKKSENYEDVGFMNQNVSLVDSVLFPEGYENIMLAVYFVTLPYIAGLLFIFLVIGKGDYTVFLALNDENSFLITWAIGYEVVAGMLLLWITKLGITHFLRGGMERNQPSKKFRLP